MAIRDNRGLCETDNGRVLEILMVQDPTSGKRKFLSLAIFQSY